MSLIAIDNGHGISTPGKRSPVSLGPVMHEYEFNSAVAKYLQNELNGISCILVSPTSVDTSLSSRVAIAVKHGVKLLISIHANAGGGTGIETFYKDGSVKGQRLARVVQEELITMSGLRDRGIKTQNLFMTRVPESKGITAILCECGFMDTRTDLILLKSDAYRQNCAKAIAKAIRRYLGV